MPNIAIIAGSGLEKAYTLRGQLKVDTPYGAAVTYDLQIDDIPVTFLPRHGLEHSVPPHRINYRANVYSLKQRKMEVVLATNAVGSLRRAVRPGDLFIPDQLLEFTKLRPFTFFDGEEGRVVHTDMTEPYSSVVRSALSGACRDAGARVHTSGVYVCTEGPRYETPAEIVMFRRLGGHVVGMTGYPEAVLARELGLEYGALCVVTNYGAGMQAKIDHKEVVELMGRSMEKVKLILVDAIKRLA